ATLTAQGHLAALLDLGRALGVALPVTGASGAVRLEAEATLGKFSGEALALKGELEFLQAGFKAASDETRPLGVELTGKARLLWQHRGDKLLAGIELQPGLSWQVFTAGGQSLQASGHLDRAFAMHMGDGQAKSEAEFPFALSSPQWGRWVGTVKQLQFKPDPASGGIGEALAKLRIRGQVPSWQHGALYAQAIGSDGEVDLRWVRDAVSSASARLQVKAGRLQLAGKTALRVQNSTWTVLAEASLPPGPLELSGLELRGELASQRVSIERGGGAPVVIGKSLVRVMRLLPEQQQGDFLLTVEEIKGDGWPGGGLRARLRLDGQKLQSDGSVQLAQTPVLNFSATHGLGKGCGQGTVTLQQDMAVLGRSLQPAPVALRPLDLQSGVVSGSFRLDWCAQPTLVFDARGKLTGKSISLGWERARIEGLDFDAQLDALQPLQARVQLAAERGQLATGTALADFRVDLALSAKALQMNALQLNLLGGSVHAGPHTLPWPLTDQTVPLEIREFDLGQLLALFRKPDLSGSGQLSGVLPLAYHDGALEVRDGRLNSLGSGTLKYAPTLAIPDNPGLQALRNLHFQKLGLEVGYASSGAYRAQLKLDGNNPDFYGGYPVRFNLNLNGELPGLFRAAIFSGDFNRHILEQLQSGKLE
ncbi:MAG TPA: YdbH domain-containing protein, partial [Rhodocyclaceae bacterium]|nr:YdbH domain-containing protein [Rhodocyclaceae bacterium]